MNKDFQKILILGLISIVISALALYSFRDVKFKNTKKMLEENQKEQEILQEYQELLSDPNEIVQPEIQKDLIKVGDLTVVMPKFFENTEFEKIARELNDKEINIDFEYINSISKYRQLILSEIAQDKVYLLPSNWIKGMELEIISIGENPKVYFHRIFNDILGVNDNTIIPYSIDPAIIIKKSGISVGNNWESLLTFTAIWEQNKSYSMPIIWGIGKNDIKFLERGDGPFENYFDILFLQLEQIKENNNIAELKNMLDVESLALDYSYDFVKFKQLYESIAKKDKSCELFPAICLMSYNFGDIKFGFLSDFDILEKYFTGNKTMLEVANFNNSSLSYPIKGRVFVVPKGSEKINLANEFFKEYLKEGVDGNKSLWGNTLSAITNIYDEQIQEDRYKELSTNENKFRLIYENINLQEEFVKNNKNINLLKGDYKPELYLK
ncbi:MAG: hypothetical protein M0P94_02945 [Candidatus Absconditabacterales bacterium]|nr:hypothetical protein [Candidatus Absconditabacterales bacterium]